MTTSTQTTQTRLVVVPEGVPFTYQYPYRGQVVTVRGVKGPEVNPGHNGGFRVLNPLTGEITATISRHALVTID